MKNKPSKNYPLAGIKVLELARVLAGPWVGQLLSDLGAEVVKVESPKGDETRTWGPPFIGKTSSSYFKSANRGKKSIVADFNSEEDLQYIFELSKKVDIIVENFKVDGLKKYKLDYKSIKKINPRIIYCSITGFGQTGPLAEKPGYDFIIQAMGGIMSLTGEKNYEPQKSGVAFADLFTGLYSTIAIQSALISRTKSNKGCHIDMSLFDTQLGVLANQASYFLTTGDVPKRMGNSHPSIVPYQLFHARNGSFIMACGNDNQFEKFCIEFGLTLYKQKEFCKNHLRVENREKLISILSNFFKKLSKKEILYKLEKIGVPNGTINDIKQAFNEKQSKHRKMIKKINGESFLRTPILFDNMDLNYEKNVPELGENTEEIKKKIKTGSFWKKNEI